MPKITKIEHKADREKFWVYVDDSYCTSIRERTFPALDLKVGQTIGCDAIKELEKHHWKHTYGKEAWEKEKIRLEKVKELIESINTQVKVITIGFGADSSEFIDGHPRESGRPDLEVQTKDGSRSVLLVEVTGAERMRGDTYWVRPGKLAFAKKHPNQDVWIILHYATPVEKFVFIKTDSSAEYQVSKKIIRKSTELYVEFTDNSPGVVSQSKFTTHLETKVKTS